MCMCRLYYTLQLPVIIVQRRENMRGRIQVLVSNAVVLYTNKLRPKWLIMVSCLPARHKLLPHLTEVSGHDCITKNKQDSGSLTLYYATAKQPATQRQEAVILLLQVRQHFTVSVRFLQVQGGTDVLWLL